MEKGKMQKINFLKSFGLPSPSDLKELQKTLYFKKDDSFKPKDLTLIEKIERTEKVWIIFDEPKIQIQSNISMQYINYNFDRFAKNSWSN